MRRAEVFTPGSHIPLAQREVDRAVHLNVNFRHYGKQEQVEAAVRRAARALELIGLKDIVINISSAEPVEEHQ